MAEVEAVQTAFFLDGLRPSDKVSFAGELKRAAGGLLDGDPAMVPIPDDMTPEAPRILLKASGDDYRCNVSINRVDVFLIPRNEEQKSAAPIDPQYQLLQRKIAGFLTTSMGVRIIRIGIVGTFLLRLGAPGARMIKAAYLCDGAPISGASEIQLHALDTVRLLGQLEVNRWVRILSGSRPEGGPDAHIARMVIDLNTVAEVRYNFDERAAERFFDEATSEMVRLLDQHSAALQRGHP